MHKKNDADTRNDVMELMERRELADAVHSEPMHATLGEDPEVVASLREQLGDAGENETDRPRARAPRSQREGVAQHREPLGDGAHCGAARHRKLRRGVAARGGSEHAVHAPAGRRPAAELTLHEPVDGDEHDEQALHAP
jgi:hypothetical protein